MRLRHTIGALALAALAAASTAAAGTPGRWDVVTQGGGSPSASQELGLARTADGVLHVAWREDTSSLTAEIRTRSISSAGQLGSAATAVSGWSLGADPTLLAAGGELRLFFAAGTPIEGLLSATAPAAGAPWAQPSLVVNEELVRGRTVGATSAADGTPIQTWYTGGDIAVHRGLAAGGVYTFGAAGTNSRPNVVTDARTGNVLVAWCTFGAPTDGTFVRRVDPGSGAPAGGAVQLPGSTTEFQGKGVSTCNLESEVSRREPIAARADGGFAVAGTAGYPTLERVLVWRLDGSGAVASTLLAASAKGVAHKEPAIAAAPDGRIWVAWVQQAPSGNVIVARRSNRAATVLGAAVTARPPGGISTGTVNLSAQADRTDLLAIVGAVGTGAKSLRHTQLLPGLTLLRRRLAKHRNGTATVTFAVLDAGDAVPGVRVRLGAAGTTTGAAGTATLVLRRGGTVTASKSGYVGARLSLRCCR
jgi:hypothetical protein